LPPSLSCQSDEEAVAGEAATPRAKMADASRTKLRMAVELSIAGR
jgi:hypothetical protein